MKKVYWFVFCCLFIPAISNAQSYQEKILAHRETYKKEFLEDENSPLKKSDLKRLRFYNPDQSYQIQSNFTRINDTIGFDMMTHNGVIKKYYVYGFITFELKQIKHRLFIYQSEKLRTKKGFEDYLFIPFNDATNSVSTFGGGRYIDLKIGDLKDGTYLLDFNTCYNPYCAYKEGYACPIPPAENVLRIAIEAGEKIPEDK